MSLAAMNVQVRICVQNVLMIIGLSLEMENVFVPILTQRNLILKDIVVTVLSLVVHLALLINKNIVLNASIEMQSFKMASAYALKELK